MTKKFILIVAGFYGLVFITSFFPACKPYDASICNIWFDNVYQETNRESNDFGAILFNLSANDNCPTVKSEFKLGMIQTCLATTLCVNWQNSILKETIELTLDKQVAINDEIIPAGTDILKHTALKEYVEINIEDNCNYQKLVIKISSNIGSAILFETGYYNITFRCSTSDYTEFEAETIRVFKNE